MRWRMVRAILRKEMGGYAQQFAGGNRAALISSSLTFLGASIGGPLLIGPYWVESAALLCVYPIIGAVLGVHGALDGIAGERERHTLETLLASPIDEMEIIAGKLAGSIMLCMGLSLVPIGLGLIAMNIVHADGALLLPAAHLIWGLPMLAVLMPAAMSSTALLVSLFSASVRNATQVYGLLLPVLLVIPAVTMILLPHEVSSRIRDTVQSYPGAGVFIAIGGVLSVVTLIALLHLKAYFRRGSQQVL